MADHGSDSKHGVARQKTSSAATLPQSAQKFILNGDLCDNNSASLIFLTCQGVTAAFPFQEVAQICNPSESAHIMRVMLMINRRKKRVWHSSDRGKAAPVNFRGDIIYF